jgi:quercetin dioxygenase-like cupin family protein
MDGVVLKPGEGERLDSRIVVKLEAEQISVNEVDVGPEFDGPGPHFHREHVDAFFVLDGTLEFINGQEKLLADAGTTVAVPPGVVHGFTNAGPGRARYLNVHTPDREELEEPSGPADAIVAPPGGGERLERAEWLVNTIVAVTDQLSIFLLEFDERWEGVDPHHHDDHLDSFYVLDGEVDFQLGDDEVRVGPGCFVAAPVGVTHGFRPIGPARMLNLHAPDAGFAGRARGR